jgi:hypothetical protein
MKRWIGPALALALAGCDTIGGIKYDFDSGSFGDRTNAVMQACAARMYDHAFDPIYTRGPGSRLVLSLVMARKCGPPS